MDKADREEWKKKIWKIPTKRTGGAIQEGAGPILSPSGGLGKPKKSPDAIWNQNDIYGPLRVRERAARFLSIVLGYSPLFIRPYSFRRHCTTSSASSRKVFLSPPAGVALTAKGTYLGLENTYERGYKFGTTLFSPSCQKGGRKGKLKGRRRVRGRRSGVKDNIFPVSSPPLSPPEYSPECNNNKLTDTPPAQPTPLYTLPPALLSFSAFVPSPPSSPSLPPCLPFLFSTRRQIKIND